MFRTKYKIEGKKQNSYEKINHANQIKGKNKQVYNKDDYNLVDIFTGASDNYDNTSIIPNTMKNIKMTLNNPKIHKEINTSIINSAENLNTEMRITKKETISSSIDIKNKQMNIKTNPYLSNHINKRIMNQTKQINDISNNLNNDIGKDNTTHFRDDVNYGENNTSNSIYKANDYDRYKSKLIPAEKLLNLNTVNQIGKNDIYSENPQNVYEYDPNYITELTYYNNKNLHKPDTNIHKRNHSNSFSEEFNSPKEKKKNYEKKNIIDESARKVIYNKSDFTIKQNKTHKVMQKINNCDMNSTNNRVSPNLNINNYASSKTNNSKNYLFTIPKTTKNQSVSYVNNFNLDKNQSSIHYSNDKNNFNRNTQFVKTNSSRIYTPTRSNKNNISVEKIKKDLNRKGSVSVKNANNKSLEKIDAEKNMRSIQMNTRNYVYSSNLLFNNKNALPNGKTIVNVDAYNAKKHCIETDLNPSEKIVDIRKHLDNYYKNKQEENKNIYFKEYMTTHDDSASKNIINDYNSENNTYISNQKAQILLQNRDLNDITSYYVENNENNNELKRFNYKDFKDKVLQDYQRSKNSNKFSIQNSSNKFSNETQINFSNHDKEYISSTPLNYNVNRAEAQLNKCLNPEINQNNNDKINYNFRKDLTDNLNSNSYNNILNLKNNYNDLNEGFNKINKDLSNFVDDYPEVKTNKNKNLVLFSKNMSYASREILKNDRTKKLNGNETIDQDSIPILSNDKNVIFNFKREKNETDILNTDNSLKPAYATNKLINEYKSFSNQSKGKNESNQNSERKSLVNLNSNDNLYTRERDVHSITNFMNNLQIMNSSIIDNNNNNNYINDGNFNHNNININNVNYEGEINNISNQIEYINERLKLNEINKNFMITKIDSKEINFKN